MQRTRRYIILLIILILAAIFTLTNNHYSTLREQESDFAIEDTASVQRIFIADKRMNSITLVRTADGWKVNDKFKATQKMVKNLLSTMHLVTVKSPVSNISRDNVLSRMAAIGTKVEVYQEVYRINLFDKIRLFPHEKLTKTYYVGDVTPDNLGTYMLIEDAKQPYITYVPGFRGFLSSQYSPKVDDWKSHLIFHHELADIKSFRYNMLEEPNEGFLIETTTTPGHYKLSSLATGEPVAGYDTLRVLNLLTSFSDVRYETRMNNIMSQIRMDSVISSPGMYEMTLVDTEDDTTYIKMFRKAAVPEEVVEAAYNKLVPVDHDRFYGLVNDGDDFVILQYFVFDKLLYPLSYYTREP